jgi:hypothetical protein
MGEAKRRKQLGLTHEDRAIDWTKRKLTATTRDKAKFFAGLNWEEVSCKLGQSKQAYVIVELNGFPGNPQFFNQKLRNLAVTLARFNLLGVVTPPSVSHEDASGWLLWVARSLEGLENIELLCAITGISSARQLFSPLNGVGGKIREQFAGTNPGDFYVPLAFMNEAMQVFCPVVLQRAETVTPTTPNLLP